MYLYFVAYCERSHVWEVYNIPARLKDDMDCKLYESFDEAQAEAKHLNEVNPNGEK